MFTKISAAEIDGVLRQSAEVIDNLLEENRSLRERIAQYDRAEYAEKIASKAVEKGLVAEDEAPQYAEKLASSERDLSVLEDFILSSPPNSPLGLVKEAGDESYEGISAEDRFMNALLESEYTL